MATQPDIPIVEDLLHRAHSPDTAASLYREKVQLRPLILRPTSPDRNRNARSKRQYERQQKARAARRSNKPGPLSAKQKRSLGVYDIPKAQQKYDIYVPLHRLWCGYMREILGIGGPNSSDGNRGRARSSLDPESAGPMLVTADYHGAKLMVVRSKCVSRVGLEGIVVKDTKATFEVVTARNELKCVPKEGTVFRFEVPFEDGVAEDDKGETVSEMGRRPLVFEIYGNRFETRAPDRAVKKVKQHVDLDL